MEAHHAQGRRHRIKAREALQLWFEAVGKHGSQGARNSKARRLNVGTANLEIARRELQRSSGFGEFFWRRQFMLGSV
jgi:hypothetical protein